MPLTCSTCVYSQQPAGRGPTQALFFRGPERPSVLHNMFIVGVIFLNVCLQDLPEQTFWISLTSWLKTQDLLNRIYLVGKSISDTCSICKIIGIEYLFYTKEAIWLTERTLVSIQSYHPLILFHHWPFHVFTKPLPWHPPLHSCYIHLHKIYQL